MLDEADIINGCIKGDSKCQSLLYQKYSRLLYGTALRYTRCEEDAQDVLQDAFLRIFDTIKQYKGSGKFVSWMTKIVINQALKLYQQQKKFAIEDYEEYQDSIKDDSIVDSDVLSHEVLLGFIRDLPEGYRMVFNLCEIEGYSYEEVAQMLGCSNSTGRSQLFKAKKVLQKKIIQFTNKDMSR